MIHDTYQTIRLHDGRNLSYEIYGERDKPVVLYFGSLTSSRIEAQFMIHPGLCIIGVDRPGYGRSDFDPQLNFHSFATDIVELIDHLGEDQVTILGASGGVPHAFAVPGHYPERVRKAGNLAGVPPLKEEPLPPNCFSHKFAIGARHPWYAWLDYQSRGILLHSIPPSLVPRLPKWLFHNGNDGTHPDTTTEDIEIFFASLKEGRGQGFKTALQDIRLFSGEWDYDLSNIHIPTQIYHGAADQITDVAAGRYYARTLPHAEYIEVPDGNHLAVTLGCREPMLSWLSTT